MARIINAAVLTAMGVTPRHLFIYDGRLQAFVSKKTITLQDTVDAAYLYNRPMPATANSNESSPEIIGTQLSLTEIIPGQAVLLVGIKVRKYVFANDAVFLTVIVYLLCNITWPLIS